MGRLSRVVMRSMPAMVVDVMRVMVVVVHVMTTMLGSGRDIWNLRRRSGRHHRRWRHRSRGRRGYLLSSLRRRASAEKHDNAGNQQRLRNLDHRSLPS